MKDNKLLILLLILVGVYSCQNNTTTSVDVERVEDKLYQLENQGWKSKQVTHFTNELYYKATQVPNEYYVLKNEGTENLDRVDSITKSLQNERIIEFEFAHNEGKDLLESTYTNMDYDKSVMYLASTIQKDFMAVTSNNDTIPCSGVLLERNFKVAPFKRVMLYFGNVPPNENIQLIYHDALYDNGIFKFKFDEIPFKQ